jgi:hypothetical protein
VLLPPLPLLLLPPLPLLLLPPLYSLLGAVARVFQETLRALQGAENSITGCRAHTRVQGEQDAVQQWIQKCQTLG